MLSKAFEDPVLLEINNVILEQGSTEPLKIWGLPAVGTRPAGGLPPLHASKYYRCAKTPGAAPCHVQAGRGERLCPWGIPGGCRTLFWRLSASILS